MNTHSLNLVSSSSQAVSITDHADLKPTGNFTIEGWIKTTHTSDQIIFQSYSQNSNVAGIRLGLADSGSHVQLISGRNNGTTLGTHWQVVTGSIAVNTGNWTHVCAVYNGSTISVYVNGILDAQVSWSNNPAYAGTNYVRIGALNTSGSNSSYFNGQIDELRLWSDARTLQEIQDNMFEELTPGSDNLIEVWEFNNSLNSKSGSHNGTGINSPTFSTSVPKVMTSPNFGSLDLELSSSQYASISHASAPNLEISGSQTWEFWIRPETNNAVQSIIGKADSSASVYRSITIDAIGTVTWNVQGINKSVTSSFSLSNGQWYHVAVVYDSTAGTLKMYINGILDDSETGVTGTITSNTGTFSIGKFGGSTTNYYYDGMVDEVRIWNVARTAQQIRDNIFQDVTGQTGLQGYWKLNGDYTDSSGNGYTLTPSGSPVFSTNLPFPEYTEINPVRFGSTTLADDANLKAYYELENTSDSSGNGFNLTNNGSVDFNSAKFNNGADFGSSNSNKYLSRNDGLGVNISGSVTVNTWVKINTPPGSGAVYSLVRWESTTGTSRYLSLYYQLFGGNFRLVANNSEGYAVATFRDLGTSEYHMVTAVCDGSTVYLYLDGILIQTASRGSTTGINQTVIGAGRNGTVDIASIISDDTSFFDRALTPTEIFELYTGLNLASSIKKVSGVTRASIKKISSIAIASVGSIGGVE